MCPKMAAQIYGLFLHIVYSLFIYLCIEFPCWFVFPLILRFYVLFYITPVAV
jgi:hypothetical protein